MWKIFHKLFGWDYVHWQNSCDSGISRILVDKNGLVYIKQYSFHWLELFNPCDSSKMIWLTCKPDKYKKNE